MHAWEHGAPWPLHPWYHSVIELTNGSGCGRSLAWCAMWQPFLSCMLKATLANGICMRAITSRCDPYCVQNTAMMHLTGIGLDHPEAAYGAECNPARGCACKRNLIDGMVLGNKCCCVCTPGCSCHVASGGCTAWRQTQLAAAAPPGNALSAWCGLGSELHSVQWMPARRGAQDGAHQAGVCYGCKLGP